jgi:hypothetical protein
VRRGRHGGIARPAQCRDDDAAHPVGVIPFEAAYGAPPTNGFWIFDRDLVRVETATAELHIDDRFEVLPYLKLFAELGRLAVYGE